jgi:AmmeMemoRadiSam system protein B
MSLHRHAVFAGQFYPATAQACTQAVDELLAHVGAQPAFGAIVPHAGWVYSGAVAVRSWAAIAAYKPRTVVVFGAAHGPDRSPAGVYPSGTWETPLGLIQIDGDLSEQFAACRHVALSAETHEREHSIEVQLPMMQRLLPEARLVPITVQPMPEAIEVGRHCGEVIRQAGERVAFVGSTDLTHYGPAFGFEPEGRGQRGIDWAKSVNDRRFIEQLQALNAEGVISEAALHRNACGAGAVAATIAATRALGVTAYRELLHMCSAEVKAVYDPDPVNSVGYEAGVFVQAD